MASGLVCPICRTPDASRVEKTWNVEDGVRRSRRCLACGQTFPTAESVGVKELLVIKRNKHKEVFNPAKVREGLKRAFTKTKVTEKYIEELTNRPRSGGRPLGLHKTPEKSANQRRYRLK